MPHTTFDDLDDLDSAPVTGQRQAPTTPAQVPCWACGGGGTKIIGYANPRGVECFTCHGTGKTKPGAKQRHDAWKKGQETQRTNLEAKRRAFDTEFPDVVEWVLTEAMKGFEFAKSLQQSLLTYGSLTDGQVAAVRRCIHASVARLEKWREEREAAAPKTGAGGAALLQALNQAYAKGQEGLKPGTHRSQPKLRTEAGTFSLAKASSKNAGCVYVKAPDGLYLGKITPAGAFLKSYDCTPELEARILKVLENPLDAAVQFGRVSGTCSCCGRRLDNAESIELGIGPICRDKYF